MNFLSSQVQELASQRITVNLDMDLDHSWSTNFCVIVFKLIIPLEACVLNLDKALFCQALLFAQFGGGGGGFYKDSCPPILTYNFSFYVTRLESVGLVSDLERVEMHRPLY